MGSREIRRQFLNFFKERGHAVIPSSPVVPLGDPTLLFINAGMNQFKDVFLGKSIREYVRATSSQKCIRVGGKHNDLENVGHTSRHLTFFEMLGNFSFGDYFKKEAIDFAWDLTLQVFQFEEEKIWATVFHEDEESFELWKKYLPEGRIVRMGEKDNFWAMGDTGPCGPCSELYFDRGGKYSPARSPAEDIEGSRFLEFWNLVFMEFNRGRGGELHRLPKQSVDTGAGLERVLSLKIGSESVFETDILRALIAQVEKVSGKSYDPNLETSAPFRVIADHTRSLAFAIADGVQPSNIERGYVLRKILRRAIRYGRQLELDKPFLATIVPRLVEMMGDDFPELKHSQMRICEILTLEEENFFRTLKRGGNILNQIVTDALKVGEISGEDAFKLKDTYGLPLEEIILLAKDASLAVDIQRFEDLEHEARERSRGSRKVSEQQVERTVYGDYFEKQGPTQFVGYEQLATDGIVLGLIKQGKEVTTLYEGEEGVILLNQTPFYAEKGGQIGDQGVIFSEKGIFDVIDCQTPFTDIMAHIGIVKTGEIHLGERISATVDEVRRQKIASNHTATHLLHWALRNVLGPHVKQAGSVVEPRRLRFDFNHHKALTKEEIEEIENQVNQKIRENRRVHIYELPFADAQSRRDIIQFFGEKYGSQVRVVDIDFSKELCGGTHLLATGSIGYFRIAKEGSIAAGVRRIEAVTGEEAEIFNRNEKRELDAKVDLAFQENKELSGEILRLKRKFLDVEVEELLAQKITVGLKKIPFLTPVVDFKGEELKECADLIMKRSPSLLLLLIGQQEEKCTVLVRASPDLIQKGIHAVDLVKEIAPLLGGKGGGKSDAAQGGGNHLQQIPNAIEHAKRWLEQQVS
jgi:alanyl-tRNA synthetase